MEIWDLYDEHRRPTGETMIRGQLTPPGRYHLIVDVLVLNSLGETLLQRRARDKEIMPDIWSVTGGSALAGEDSVAASIRETEEEMGFTPDMAHARLLFSERKDRPGSAFFRDVWLVRQDVPLSQMRWQPEEVQDGQWILPEKAAADPKLWDELSQMHFWRAAYPYLLLESMRIRIPQGACRRGDGKTYWVEGLSLDAETLAPAVRYRVPEGAGESWTCPARLWLTDAPLPGDEKLRF